MMQVNAEEKPRVDPRTVLSIILGGGAGTRLYPLTKRRAKPAVSSPTLCSNFYWAITQHQRMTVQIVAVYCREMSAL